MVFRTLRSTVEAFRQLRQTTRPRRGAKVPAYATSGVELLESRALLHGTGMDVDVDSMVGGTDAGDESGSAMEMQDLDTENHTHDMTDSAMEMSTESGMTQHDTTTHTHDTTGHEVPAGSVAPEISATAVVDGSTGANLYIELENFTLSPESASTEYTFGEGHLHVYVDGDKVGRFYNESIYLGDLSSGIHVIEVEVSGNDHASYLLDGHKISEVVVVTIPEATDHSHSHTMAVDVPEGQVAPSAELNLNTDPAAGYNLHVDVSNFDFAAESVNGEHVSGEGHLHVYVDGEKVTRLYGEWYHLSLSPGEHEVSVEFATNDHRSYAVDGTTISVSTTIVVPGEVTEDSQTDMLLPVDGEDLVPGGDGTVVNGSVANAATGSSVSATGDINGDGIDDFIIGGPSTDVSAGAAYVVFGTTAGLPSELTIADLDGTNGFALTGVTNDDMTGSAVAGIGDFNNDGYADMVISAPGADPGSLSAAGSVYVVFGKSDFASVVALSSLNGTSGFRIDGLAADDMLGKSVGGIGDVNGDTFDDLVLSAPGADSGGLADSGATYVIFGSATSAATFDLSSVNGTTGFQLNGAAEGDEFGYSVGSAGDINNDGFGDVIVGAPGADPGGELDAGSSYVYFGKASGFAATTTVSALDGSDGFRLDGVNADDRSGYEVGGEGDINDDGFGDIIIGSPRAEVDGISIGAAYVYLGKASGFDAAVGLYNLDGTNGFRLTGDYEYDPLLNSFIVNTTGQTAHEVEGQNTDLVEDALVNFTSIVPDGTSVYATTSGISFQVIGPFPGNPGTVSDQDRTHVIPISPEEETGEKTATTTGSTAVWIDGVSIYNWSDAMSYENAGVWNQNAVFFEGNGLDENGGHPPPGGEYHTHAVNIGLMTDLGDDGSGHSPILGWSYEGYPIYGPWGYVNDDGTGGIAKQDSSWQVRAITERTHLGDGTDVADGPPLAEQPLGAYIEDYEYVEGLGDLDEFNGRFSVTPEYPEGIYHYVVTIDDTETISVDSAVFPYVIGLDYYGVVETDNLTGGGGGDGGPPPDGGGGPPDGGGGPPVDGGEAAVIEPAAGDISVAIVDDGTGDGIDDIVIGDPDAYVPGQNSAGAVFIVPGQTEPSTPDVDLGDLDGTNGERLDGLHEGDLTGASVGSAGDVNGDGVNDILVGAPGSDVTGNIDAGQTFVLTGEAVAPGTAQISIANASLVTEGQGLVFTLTIDQNPTSNVTVLLSTADGTATAGGDYTAISGQTITFVPGGSLTQSVTVATINDVVQDSSAQETLFVNLSSPSGATLINDQAVGYIADNERLTQPTVDAIPRYPDTDSPTITWDTVTGAASYNVWLTRRFPSVARVLASESSVATTAFTPSVDLDSGYYKVWVQAVDSNGIGGTWSNLETFEIRPDLGTSTIASFVSPPTFTWNAIPNAPGYELFIRTSDGDTVIDNITSTSYVPTTSLSQTSGRWWIRSSDAIGNRGWSLAGTFGTQTAIVAPTGTQSTVTPAFNWVETAGASRYILHVTNLDTNSVEIREDALTANSYTPTSALASGNYRAWVKAIDGASNLFSSGQWSTPVDFTIAETELSIDSDTPQSLTALALASDFDTIEVATVAKSTEGQSEQNDLVPQDRKEVASIDKTPIDLTGSKLESIQTQQDTFLDQWMENFSEIAMELEA